MNGHRARLFWLPGQRDGEGCYQIRCLDCGAILVDDPLRQDFEIVGDCTPPDTIGINVSEQIGIKDRLR